MKESGVRAIRGAISCDVNSVEEISVATQELISACLEANRLTPSDCAYLLFTTTPDLNAAFPAAAARAIGFSNVPLMCASEIDVPGAMPRVIRLLMVLRETEHEGEAVHSYLRDAKKLRPDV